MVKSKLKIILTLVGLGLIVFSAASYAQETGSLANNLDLFKPTDTDRSMRLLASIFGRVSNVLPAGTQGGGNIFSGLFEQFNRGLLAVALIIVAYTLVMLVLNTSQEGRVLGGRINPVLSVLRIVIGFSILVPRFNGYSFVQVAIMWVVVHGIGFADTAWNYVIDRLIEGQPLYVGASDVENALNVMKVINKARLILKSQVCMSAFNAAANIKDSGLSGIKFAKRSYAPGSKLYSSMYMGANKPITGLLDDSYTVCGQIYYGDTAMSTRSGSPDKSSILDKYTAIKSMFSSMQPFSQRLVSTFTSSESPNWTILKNDYLRVMLNSTLDYYTIMRPQAKRLTSKVDEDLKEQVKKAKEYGWVLAGAFYRYISDINAKAQVDYDKLSDINFRKEPMSFSDIDAKLGEDYKKEMAVVKGVYDGFDKLEEKFSAQIENDVRKEMAVGGPKPKVKGVGENLGAIGAVSGVAGVVAFLAFLAPAAPLFLTILAPIGVALVGLGSMVGLLLIVPALVILISMAFLNGLSGEGDPIVVMTRTGYTMLGLLFWGFLAATLVNYTVQLLSHWFDAILSIGAAAGSVSTWVLGILIPLLFGLGVPAFMLGVYLPFIPFMIFFLASIGWVIAVIEAMVAGPLVALGVTHPEGHDFLGKAEQALMLLLSVFLRPVLMIIGFVAAMIVSRAVLGLMNEGFIIVMNSVDVGDIKAVLGTGGLSIAGTVIVYALLIVSVVNMTYSLVHVIPDRILRWIGGSPENSGVEQELGAIRQGVQQGASSLGDVGKGAGEGSDKAGEEAGKSLGKAFKKVGKELGVGKKSPDTPGAEEDSDEDTSSTTSNDDDGGPSSDDTPPGGGGGSSVSTS